MLTSRRMLLWGCPLIIIIIGLTLWSFLADAAQNQQTQGRSKAVRSVKETLQLAAEQLEKFADSRRRQREDALGKLEMQSRQIAGEAAALLIPSLRRINREKTARKLDRAAGFYSFLSALGITSGDSPDARYPISYQDAISENRDAFKTLIPESGGMLSLLNTDGKILWQIKKIKRGSLLAPAVKREIPFTRGGVREKWIFAAALPRDSVPPEPRVVDLAATLERELLVNRKLDKNLLLSAVSADGTELFSIPASRSFPEDWLTRGFDSWQELAEPDAQGRAREVFSARRTVRVKPVAYLAARIFRKATAMNTVFATEFKQRPYLFLGAAALLVLLSATFVWALRQSAPRRGRESSLPRLDFAEPGRQLLPAGESQGGGGGSPGPASGLPPGEKVLPGGIPPSVYPAPDRQSNILRLRELYRSQDGGLLKLNGERVRSPILRELLARVGNGSLPKDKEK